MSGMDTALSSALSIVTDVESNLDQVLTEEDAKFRLISRVLTECLGWPFASIHTERQHESGFSDYIIRSNERNAILLEAKRIGILEVSVAEKTRLRTLKLSGPALSKCRAAVEQAANYALPAGLPLAVVTDGVAWIVFKPHVTGEHFLTKEAFIFPSLQAVISDFNKFYDLLSRDGFGRKNYAILFDEIHNPRMLLGKTLVASVPEGSIHRDKKSEFAFDLDKVFDTFFSRMRGDIDPDMLIECFVETRESRIADFTLEKMTAQVLGNIDPTNRDIGQQLSVLIGNTVAQDEGENVFIVGPTGSGKTTFLDRFFRKTLSPEIRGQVVPLRLNFLDATGSVDAVQAWMTNELIAQIEKYSFEDGVPSWEELRGLYYTEYKRRSKGTDARLYASNKPEFQLKFGEYMNEKVENDREGYLRRLISDLVSNRKKLPVMIIDNTDEFGMSFKETVFQFVQSLRRHAKHCMVIQPLTDKSAWSFSKTDLFGIYRTKSFFLPTPAPKEVFRKRIDFLKLRIKDEDSSVPGRTYFTDKGIRISIPNLEKFAQVLEDHFVNDEMIARTLGELANYNIRVTLHLARRVMTSAVLGIENLLSAYISGGSRPTTRKQFLNALLRGDHNYFKAGDIPEIVNLFQVDDKIRQSPLLHLRLLALLQSVANAARDVDAKHLSVGSLHDYFEVLGATEVSVDTAIKVLVGSRLVEKFDPSTSELLRDQRLAITHSGRAHLRMGLKEFVYFEQMALTTLVTSEEYVESIRSSLGSRLRADVKFAEVRSKFAHFLISEDQKELSVPVDGVQFSAQRDLTREIEAFITKELSLERETEVSREASSSLVTEVETEEYDQIVSGVVATVDWFSYRLGYGFVDCAEFEEKVFLHADVLRDSGIINVRDGDDLLCEIVVTRKGPQVSKVVDVQTKPSNLATESCRVVRVFDDRGYGFVRPLNAINDASDAFFHFSVLHDVGRDRVAVNDLIEVEIRLDVGGRGRQVAKVKSVSPFVTPI